MSMESKERKKFSLRRFFISFKYSFDGLKYAYLNEQSMLLHLICTIIIISLGIFFKISLIEWIICITLLACIMCIELLNSAIEATVDLVTKEKKETVVKALLTGQNVLERNLQRLGISDSNLFLDSFVSQIPSISNY